MIAIAHRLSTIAAMDRLIVLEEGDIAGTGTPTAAWSCERREAQESDPRRRRGADFLTPVTVRSTDAPGQPGEGREPERRMRR